MKARPQRWLVVSYEELLLSARSLIPILGRRLGLDHPERMLRALRIPSPSTHGDSHAKLQDEDPMEQIRSWQGDVDSETEAGLFRIVDRFDIDIYRRGSAMPDRAYRNLQ